jgi:predicted metal-dependent enzyme (double-stranded beta helix superfamily)
MTSTTLAPARPTATTAPAGSGRRRAAASATPLPESLPAHREAALLAESVAEQRHLWAPGVRFDPAAPHETVVWADDRWEVVVGTWLPGQSSATVARLARPGVLHVLQGTLDETTWVTATDGPTPGLRHAVTRRYTAGATRSHGTVHVHDVRNPGPDPAVALHVHARTYAVRRPA